MNVFLMSEVKKCMPKNGPKLKMAKEPRVCMFRRQRGNKETTSYRDSIKRVLFLQFYSFSRNIKRYILKAFLKVNLKVSFVSFTLLCFKIFEIIKVI